MFAGAVAFGAFANSFRASSKTSAASEAIQSHDAAAMVTGKKPPVFDHHFRPFQLGEVINLSEDSAIFRFLLHSPEDEFDLVACSTLQASFREGMNLVDQPMRFYTPITPNGTKGYFDLIVRKYPNGRFTEHLFGMEAGETLLFRCIQYKMRYKPNKWREVGLIGGGTGITSLLQVMRASFGEATDKTKMSLLYASRSESKILLRGLIDDFAARFANRLKVTYIIDKPEDPATWKGRVGHITQQLIQETMPAPANDICVLICGPDPMMSAIVGAPPAVLKQMSGGLAIQPAMANLNNLQDVAGYMGKLGYAKEMLYRF
jgi:cytochrome-b5 reductase